MAAIWRLANSSRLSRLYSISRQLRQPYATTVDEEKPEPPNGFLFNEKPLLPGEKRQKEEWENIWVYGMGFNFLLFLVVYLYKPDTSISSWAKGKAQQRLQEEEESA